MPRHIVDPKDERATYSPGQSVSFQVSGSDSEMLIPRVRLVGRVYFTGTGNTGTMSLPSNLGAHALIRSLYVSSARRSNILNIIEYPRYMALCRAGTRPEDRFSDADDLSSPSLSITRGQISGASSAATAIPFSIELEQLNAGLFSRQLPFAKFGNFEVQISLSSAAEAMIQDAGNVDASFVVTELSLCFDTAPFVGKPATLTQPQTFICPEVQRLEIESSRMTITQPFTQTLISAGIIFTRQTSLNNVAASQGMTEAPPGLESVKFSMLGEDMQQFDVVIQDPYAAQVQTGFYTALLGAGLPVTIADSVVARASAGDLRWRFANTDANLGSTVLPINGVGVPDSYGIGIAFPPSGANGNLAVSLQWTPGATNYTAHLVLFYQSAA
jgi:hypothetical protein